MSSGLSYWIAWINSKAIQKGPLGWSNPVSNNGLQAGLVSVLYKQELASIIEESGHADRPFLVAKCMFEDLAEVLHLHIMLHVSCSRITEIPQRSQLSCHQLGKGFEAMYTSRFATLQALIDRLEVSWKALNNCFTISVVVGQEGMRHINDHLQNISFQRWEANVIWV